MKYIVKIVRVTTVSGSILNLSSDENTFCAQKTNKNNDFTQLFISFSVGLEISRTQSLGCTPHASHTRPA